MGVPVDVDELLEEADLARYVREHVLRHFPTVVSSAPGASDGDESNGPFWFVREAALRERLAADWHEAQDVCHVLGWRSCVALCGGILEALLMEALERGGRQAASRSRTLSGLAAAAAESGLLGPEPPRLAPPLASFAALIRPARRARAAGALTRADADAALDTVRIFLRRLAEITKTPPVPAGR